MKTQKEVFGAFPDLEVKLKTSIAKQLAAEGKIERKRNSREHNRIEYSEEHAKVLTDALALKQAELSNAPLGGARGAPGASGQGKSPDGGRKSDESTAGKGGQPGESDESGQIRTDERLDVSGRRSYATGLLSLLRGEGITAPKEQPERRQPTGGGESGSGSPKLANWQTIAFIVGIVLVIGIAVWLFVKMKSKRAAKAPPSDVDAIKRQLIQRQATQGRVPPQLIDLGKGSTGVNADIEALIQGIR